MAQLTAIQPQAAPVSAFVRPAVPVVPQGPSRVGELVSALSGFQPSLMNFLGHKADQVNQAAADDAVAKRAQTGKNYKDAVSQGLIPPSKNPFFLQAYQEQDGKVAADQYNADLHTALVVGDFAKSTDPNETESLLTTFRSNWMKQAGVDPGNKDFMKGFAQQAQQYEGSVRSHQNEMVSQRILQNSQEGLYRSAQGSLDAGLTNNLPASEVADGIQTSMQKMIDGGLPPQEVNRIILDAASAKAVETNSMHPFDVIDAIKTGSGFLGRTAAAVLMKEQIQNRINAHIQAVDAHAHELKVWADQETDERVTSDIWTEMFKNKLAGAVTTVANMAPKLMELAKVNPQRAESMKQQILDSSKPDPKYDNEAISSQLTVSLFEGNLRQDEIVSAYSTGQLTLSTARDLLDSLRSHNRDTQSDYRAADALAYSRARDVQSDARAERAEARTDRPKDVYQVPAFKEGSSGIKQAFGYNEFGDNSKISPDIINKMNLAVADYYVAAQKWRDNNPNAMPEDFTKKATELRQIMLNHYVPPAAQNPINQINQTITPAPLYSFDRLTKNKAEWDSEYANFIAGKPNKISSAIKQYGMNPEVAQAFVNFQKALNTQ